jgi:hypothetical protein
MSVKVWLVKRGRGRAFDDWWRTFQRMRGPIDGWPDNLISRGGKGDMLQGKQMEAIYHFRHSSL